VLTRLSAPEVTDKFVSAEIPPRCGTSVQHGSAEKVVAGDAGDLGSHDARWTGSAALIAQTSCIASKASVRKKIFENRDPVIAPHGREVAEIGSHPTPVN
jgi:hypothetical protein